MKKTLAILLCLVFALSLGTVAAFAAGEALCDNCVAICITEHLDEYGYPIECPFDGAGNSAHCEQGFVCSDSDCENYVPGDDGGKANCNCFWCRLIRWIIALIRGANAKA